MPAISARTSAWPVKPSDPATCAIAAYNQTLVDNLTLVGFGTFSTVARAARTGRNPQTGKAIKIAAKTKIDSQLY